MKACQTERGLTVHHRHMHEEEYHVENVPVPHVNARWDGEELVLLAREELWLTQLGEKNINHKLADKFPHRSFDSTNGVWHKGNVKYWKVFQDLFNENELAVSPIFLPSSNRTVNDVSLQMEWFYKLRSEIFNFSYEVPIDVNNIMPCVLTHEL